MFALTMDLLVTLAAWSAVAYLWMRRRAVLPQTVWEKLTSGATLIAMALTVRMADAVWSTIPWPALATPLVQQIGVAIGLFGGGLAMVAGLVEWIPGIVADGVVSRWRARWSESQMVLERSLAHVEEADRAIQALLAEYRDLCATAHVHYCAFRQRSGDFVLWGRPTEKLPVSWQAALDRLEAARTPTVAFTGREWLATIPVAVDHRLYGAVLIRRQTEHTSLSQPHLLCQTAQRCALTLHRIVRHAASERQARTAACVAQLERLLGAGPDPVDDLLKMLDIVHRELDVEYASCLVIDGDGSYARRYSRSWEQHGLAEKGLQVPLDTDATTAITASGDVLGTQKGRTAISRAAVGRGAGLDHELAISLKRGGRTIAVLTVASAQTPLRFLALDRLKHFSPAFTSAVERINDRTELRRLEQRLAALGKAAAHPVDVHEGFDQLTRDMLDEIPGTFCQFMRVTPDQKTLRVHYRRSRRNGWGHDTAGLTLDLGGLPTCRMVVENGRSVMFRQDDPERHYDPEEADLLFGAVPNSVLMVPVMHDGICSAILAVGEMRETGRNSFGVEDRRFADSFVNLATRRTFPRLPQTRLVSLDALGDLKFTFSSPLTGILGSVEILRQHLGKNLQEARYLDVIERNADRIREVVGELAELQHAHGPVRHAG